MRVDREERGPFSVGFSPTARSYRAVNFYHPTTLLKLFMDSLLTHKHFYVNLMIGKRIISLRLPILDCGIAPGGESRGFFMLNAF